MPCICTILQQNYYLNRRTLSMLLNYEKYNAHSSITFSNIARAVSLCNLVLAVEATRTHSKRFQYAGSGTSQWISNAITILLNWSNTMGYVPLYTELWNFAHGFSLLDVHFQM
jgi:hypothetical protein